MRVHQVMPLASAVLSALVVGVAGGASANRAVAAGSWTGTFSDPSGDAAAAPDVMKAVITGDAATGVFVIRLNVDAAVPASPDGLTRLVTVWLDTDKNDATGSSSGCEYLVQFYDNPADPAHWWAIARWDGSAWQDVDWARPMSFIRSGAELAWTLSTANLGGATGFDMYATASLRDADGNRRATDVAPDDGGWEFDIAGPSRTIVSFVVPTIGKPATVPRTAVAGKRITVSFPVTVTEDGKTTPLATGTMVCDPSIAGKVIRHAESLNNGAARLAFVVPKNAKGKQLKVKVTIKAPSTQETGLYLNAMTGNIGVVAWMNQGQSATRVATYTVR